MKPMNRTKLYQVWVAMKSRCLNPNNKRWGRYGGRGIRVCDHWSDNYWAFHQWAMANGYGDGMSIDRIDPNGNYSPYNCQWIPLEEQAKNRCRKRLITAFGETKTLSEWTKDSRCRVNRITIHSRLKAGCPAELAITSVLHGNSLRKHWAN